jgi:hypothetical protein
MNTSSKRSAFAGLKSTMRIAPPGTQQVRHSPHKETAAEIVSSSPAQRTKKAKSSKRGHPDYQPVSTHIFKPVHRAVRVELVKEDDRDLADLLDELLRDWLKRRGIVVAEGA